MDISISGDHVELTLADVMDISSAAEDKANLLDALGKGLTVKINAEAIERIDTAGLQAMCAFVETAHSRNVDIDWIGHSDSFKDAARTLNLESCLGI